MFLRWRATLRSASTGYWKGAGFMPLTRGEAVGYDADLMVFEFTMRNGEQIVPTLPTSDCGSLSISL